MADQAGRAKAWLRDQWNDFATANAGLGAARMAAVDEMRRAFPTLAGPRLTAPERVAIARAPKRSPPTPTRGDPVVAANPSGARPVALRGAQGFDPPRRRREYLVDLTDPANGHLMTRLADQTGTTAYIEEYPTSNLGVRTSLPELKADIAGLLAGRRPDPGPRVTYRNDDPSKPTSRQPLTADTAGMIAAAIVDSGLDSVNINSTTGGHPNPTSLHNHRRAVDMNRLNGRQVGLGGRQVTDPLALPDVMVLQDALARQPNIYENFGPAYQEKWWVPGQPSPAPTTRRGHQNHVHGGGRR